MFHHDVGVGWIRGRLVNNNSLLSKYTFLSTYDDSIALSRCSPCGWSKDVKEWGVCHLFIQCWTISLVIRIFIQRSLFSENAICQRVMDRWWTNIQSWVGCMFPSLFISSQVECNMFCCEICPELFRSRLCWWKRGSFEDWSITLDLH